MIDRFDPADPPAAHPPGHRPAFIPASRSCAALTLAALCWLAVALPAWAATPFNIAVARSPQSLPLYVAQAEGYFTDEGLAPKLSDWSDNIDPAESFQGSHSYGMGV